jgi:hypothetical protein
MTEPSSFNPLLDHEKCMIALALTAWDEELSDPQTATLREIGIDRADWGTRFGSRLASYDREVYEIPKTWEELSRHYQEFPNGTLRSLADAFVRRLHGEVRRDGVDKLTLDAAAFAYIDAKLEEAQSGRDTDDPMVLALREPLYLDETPAIGKSSAKSPGSRAGTRMKRGTIVRVGRVGRRFVEADLDSGERVQVPLAIMDDLTDRFEITEEALVFLEAKGRLMTYVQWAGTQEEFEALVAADSASDSPADTDRQPDGAPSRLGSVRSVIWYVIFSAVIVAAIVVLHLPQWVLIGYLGIATIGLVMAVRARD